MVYNWIEIIRKWLFPPQCRLCLGAADATDELCNGCRAELPWLGPACIRCALPIDSGSSDICATCLDTPPALDACYALFAYAPPIDQWIQALKFQQDLAISHSLGELLAGHPRVRNREDNPGLLAVPLHWRRLASRGYNQARELARPLESTGLRPARLHCRRTRHTAAQSRLGRGERRQNLEGIFDAGAVEPGARLLLVDDVMTTGATLEELARTLKRAGAARVEALVVARTLALR